MNMLIEMAGEKYEVRYVEDTQIIAKMLRMDEPKWITFDTETTGLHLKRAQPFLGAVCWDVPHNPDVIQGIVYVFPVGRDLDTLSQFGYWASLTDRVYAHNTTFDMHMLANATDDDYPLCIKNWGDTMGLCRLTFEAISSRDGGDSLALKTIATKYIDPTANRYEKEVKGWLKAKVAYDKKLLIALLKTVGWSVTRFEAATNKGTEEVPKEVLEIFLTWKQNCPPPNYQDVPMDIMLPYVAVDVILTNILVRKALPVVEHRQQNKIMEMEFRLLRTVYKMEREGIEVDRGYLEEAGFKLENYIADLQIKMCTIAGREFRVGQHAVVKDIYEERLGERPASSDKQFLNQQKNAGDDLAGIISQLRRLEKWKETYIERILENSSYDGRFYTSLGQFNPVSGRFSSDAQQFPKEAIYHAETGEELFRPRRAFILPNGYYLDYSQVELRYQAHHTIHTGGDVNLCRAYMPFRCIHSVTGETYRFDTVAERWRWNEMKEGAPADMHWEDQLKAGWSVWLQPVEEPIYESFIVATGPPGEVATGTSISTAKVGTKIVGYEPWKPTDVHSATSLRALAIMGVDISILTKDELKKWRDIGKRFNFMRNYGGGDKKAAETLEIPLASATAMNKGYSDAFPMVVLYQKNVEKAFQIKGYVQSASSRRYYLSDSWRFYKGGNYLIQGPCADILKEKMIIIDDYIVERGLGIRMILCVHDELQFRVPIGEDAHMAIIQDIMQDTPGVLVPIVAEMERTDRYWSDKVKILSIA